MRYEHDCEKCKTLGKFKEFDLYFCEQQGGGATVIARFGPGGDYYCGMRLANSMPALKVAKRRAIAAGLITA